MRLAGKVALVTGGSRGIGAAIVALFAREGARVSFCARQESPGLELQSDLRKEGLEVTFIACDVSKENSVKELVRKTIERYSKINILVNNAGIAETGRVESMSLRVWQRVLNVNINGMFLATKYCIPHLRRGRGNIVNLGSTYGLVGAPGFAPYALSKAAAINFSKTMALELATDRIRVNALCPGATRTPSNIASLLAASDPHEAEGKLVGQHPIGRLATPIEQAYGALYLASDEASFVTGSALLVDGGYTAI
jgi:NAD(P)-dependent dehydrogenase (short-subunit alcohol dehydrogenase family)